MNMFRNRTHPPIVSASSVAIQEKILKGFFTRGRLVIAFSVKELSDAIREDAIIEFDKNRYTVPEHFLLTHTKEVAHLQPYEADYFAAKLLGFDVVIEPVARGVLESPLVCVNRSTGSWCCPTIQWELAKKLRDMFRMEVVYDTTAREGVATTAYTTTRRPNICEAVVYAALSASATEYEINYHGACDDTV